MVRERATAQAGPHDEPPSRRPERLHRASGSVGPAQLLGRSRAPPSNGPRVTRDEAKDLGRIRRSLTDRKIAGVAGGIARHFDIDPLLVRVGLVLLVIFGGGGILLYAAGWLLIPEEGSDDGVIKVDHRTRTVLLAVVGAIAALSLLGDSFGGWEFPWPLAIIGLVIAADRRRDPPEAAPRAAARARLDPAGHARARCPDARTGAGATYPGYQPGAEPQPVDHTRAAGRSCSGSPWGSPWSASSSSPPSTWPGGTRRSRPIPRPCSRRVA